MDESVAQWSPQPPPGEADRAPRCASRHAIPARRWRHTNLACAQLLVALGLGCGGSGVGPGGSDAGGDAGTPDANGPIPDARDMGPDAGPPPFFDYPVKLTASDGAPHNWFGWSVAATADVIVVGAPFYDELDEEGAIVEPAIGAVYVFERSGGEWSQTARLITANEETSAMFGYSVATNGDIIAVGAWKQNVGSQSGAVFVFERSGGSWVETAMLEPFSGDDQERFGFAVSMSGGVLAVGAPLIDEVDDPSTPAYIFEKGASGSWSGTRLVASDDSIGGMFGYSIAVSGDTVVVGAPHDSTSATNAGSAYVFERDGNSWTEVAELTDPDADPMDFFGRGVAIDLDTIVVGVEFGGAPSLFDTGAAHVFERADGTWTEAGRLYAADNSVDDRFGAAMAVHGDRLIAGAFNRDDMGAQSGAAYVFERGASGWSEISKLTSIDGAPGDNLGSAVAVVGDMVVVGSRYDDDDGMDSGSVYVFERLPDM